MTLALFPLGAIALWQTNEVVTASVRLSEEIVLSETERAAAREQRLMERGRGAAEGLAALLGPMIDEPDRCSEVMERFISRQDTYIFAGFIQSDGMMACTSNGISVDFAEDPSFARALDRRSQMFEVNLAGAATGESVVIISNPVMVRGRFAGFISLSLPHGQLDAPVQPGGRETGFEYVTVNREGQVLFATSALPTAGQLHPADIKPSDFITLAEETFLGEAIDGRERLFAVSTIVPEEVVVVGSWPIGRSASALTLTPVWVPLLFPVLMWFAGSAVAFLGLHRLVTRHIYHMRGAMRLFAVGKRDGPELKLDDPPDEFEVLENSFNRMVQTLTQAEAQAERDLDEKSVLLREIHHRVKNNLQLIASIMNMHARTATTPETKVLLSQLQQRGRGLATVHQTLNAESDETTIDARNLIQRLVRELIPIADNLKRPIRTKTSIVPVELGQDQAVTLAMLTSETLTNAVKYIDAPDTEPLHLNLTLAQDDTQTLRFSIENTIAPGRKDTPDLVESTGIGSRLMRAFVAQLEGEAVTDVTDTHFRYSVVFPLAEVKPEATAKPWANASAHT